MKVLLCLLSDQHVPNLLSVHHFRPDRLVLVESTAMQKKRAAENFKWALQLGGLDFKDRCDVEILDAEDNLDAVREVLRRAYGKYPTASWIANVTGGTKPMSIAAFEFFKATAGRVVYTNFSRPTVLLSLESRDADQSTYKLSSKEFLAGYGFESRKSDDKLNQAEDRARTWSDCANVIAKNALSQDLLQISDGERAEARKRGWDIKSGQLTSPSKDVEHSIAATFALSRGGDNRRAGRIDKYAAEFLTGGWLEVFFWNLLSRHSEALGVWDVRLGLEVGRRGDSSGNDFDVAFMQDHGLSMIECKSGSQENDPGTDILYKVEAVTRQFRALRVRSYLATTGTNVLDREHNLKSSVQNRAAIYNCRIIRASDINKLAKEDGAADAVRDVLFGATAES